MKKEIEEKIKELDKQISFLTEETNMEEDVGDCASCLSKITSWYSDLIEIRDWLKKLYEGKEMKKEKEFKFKIKDIEKRVLKSFAEGEIPIGTPFSRIIEETLFNVENDIKDWLKKQYKR